MTSATGLYLVTQKTVHDLIRLRYIPTILTVSVGKILCSFFRSSEHIHTHLNSLLWNGDTGSGIVSFQGVSELSHCVIVHCHKVRCYLYVLEKEH